MAHVSHRLKGPFEGALAGGGDPATSPLHVFGPFLKLLAASGAGAACFGAPIWLVVLTVVVVSLMYDGAPAEHARKAFDSLAIIMVATLVTMAVVGPAIYALADPGREDVSVFTQAMDRLLPGPLAYLGTLVGIVVLLSAAAASAQGLQNLALGLRHRHYVPAAFGQRNRFDVADRPYGEVLAKLLVEIPEAEVPSFLDHAGAIGLAVRRVGADLLVASADRPALRALPKHAAAPVLFVRASAAARRRYTLLSNVVVGLDGSSPAAAVLPYARSLLRAGARVALVAVPDGGEPEMLAAYVERLAEALRPEGAVDAVAAGSGPVRTLVSIAEERDADLVVVASHGRGGTSRAVDLGSVPTKLLSELDRPLLIVPSAARGPDTFASPGIWRDGRAGDDKAAARQATDPA